MATLGELNVIIGAQIDDFERAMAEVEQGIGRAGKAAQAAGGALSTALTLPITLLAGASLKAAGDIQALEKGFSATYKGSLPLQDALANVRELAKLPGLGLKEALQGATNLQAAGFSADLAARSLAAFGNALATVGKGKADLDGVGLALSQIASKGKISAEEIGQLSERVPQIRKAMQAAFGTSDTEVLQKAGIGATEFVEKVTAELEKLPKVTGGINNAFENLADAGTISLAKLGDALNKSFNVEGILGEVADFVSGLASSFAELDPTIQKAVFLFAGVAAAVGPALLALGALASAAPLIAGAFAVITGPVGLAIAVIAGAAAAIILNWDKVSAYFTTGEGGRVFNGLAAAAQRAYDALKPILSALAEIVKTQLGVSFKIAVAVAEAALNTIASAVTSVLNVIADYVQVFRGVFTKDWQAVWDGVKRIFLDTFLFLTSATRAFTGSLLSTLSGVAEKLGAVGISKFLNEAAAANANLEGNLKRLLGITDPVAKSLGGVAEAGKELGNALGKAGEVAGKTAALTQDQVKALAALQEALRLNAANSRALGDSYDYMGGKQSALESGIKSLIKAGFNPLGSTVQGFVGQLRTVPEELTKIETDISRFFDRITKQQEGQRQADFQPFGNLVVPPIPTELSAYDAEFDRFREAVGRPFLVGALDTTGFTTAADTIVDTTSTVVNSITGMSNATLERLTTFNTEIEALFDSFGGYVSNGLSTVADSIGAAAGSILSGSATIGNGIGLIFNGILTALADFAGNFGKQLIAIGVGKLALDTLFKGPAGGPLAIAAGIGLVALAGVAKSLIKNSASAVGSIGSGGTGGGGGGFAPTAAPSTRTTPTAAATREQNNTQEVIFRLDGRDMVGVLQVNTAQARTITGRSQIGQLTGGR